MRRTLTALLVSALVALTGLAPASACGPHAWLRIAATTTDIVMIDTSPNSSGAYEPSVSLRVRLKGCPAGWYTLEAGMYQDGVVTRWATQAKGAVEFKCNGDREQDFSWALVSTRLHPGSALAIVRIVDWTTRPETIIAADERTVHVPGHAVRPPHTTGPKTTIRIAPRTSAIYQYQFPGDDTGYSFPAVTLTAVVRNCPTKHGWFRATLMVDWKFPYWNNARHGGTQLDCAGLSRQKLTLYWAGGEIHSGKAWVHVEVGEGDRIIAQETRAVRIP